MTCIVGLEHEGNVWIGGDSAASSGTSLVIRSDEKVFMNGPMIFGFTTSFRLGQLLRFALRVPKKKSTMTDYEYLVTDFIASIRKIFVDHGYSTSSGTAKGGDFLLGYNGSLYTIYSDFQVARAACGYSAVGCGFELALGALHLMVQQKYDVFEKFTGREMVSYALSAATSHSANVSAPYTIMSSGKKKISRSPRR